MKTRINKKHAMIAMMTLLVTMVLLVLAATPALAGPVHLTKEVLHDITRVDPDVLRDVLDRIEDLEGDHDGPFPDGGGWEPAFPGGIDPDEIRPELPVPEDVIHGDDEEAGEDTGEAVETDDGEEADETGTGHDETAGDDATEAEEPDESEPSEDLAGDEGEEEDESDESTLPFTGGNSTPWFIAGAAVILVGIMMVTRRRRSDNER